MKMDQADEGAGAAAFEESARRQGIPRSLRHSAVFLMKKARAQAIDDCIKVVRKMGANDEDADIDTCDAIASRLEALKEAKP